MEKKKKSGTETSNPEVSFSELKNGVKGVSIGEEDIFIEITKKKKLWKLKVQDMFSNDVLTGWIKLLDFGDLRHSRRAKPIREVLKKRWPKHFSKIVEQVIIQIEGHKSEWQAKKDSQTEETKPCFSEEVEGSIQIELAKIVDAENQLQMLNPHLDNVIVKEENNKKAISVLLAGSKFSELAKKQIILLKGTEGGGKSTLARELCRSYRVKEVGRFSAHALDYSNLKGVDVLLLKELGAMDMEKQGVSTLKFLSSDDRGYTVEITVKDEETGRFTTEQHRIPCMTVVSTTTRLILDSQFERRAWLFNVDETKEQTKEVTLWKAKRKKQQAEKLLGLREITDYEFSQEILKRFAQQLKPEKIIIPFPETLTEVLGYDVLRVRGDLDKIYAFVELYGLFNLKRLQKLKEDVYALTPQVCMEALQIVMKPLANMISRMDERTAKILSVLKELELDKSQDVISKVERDRIAVKSAKSERVVRRFLNFLENSGFLSSDNKKPKSYTLLYSVESIEAKLSGILDKLQMSNLLMDKMTKEAQNMLKTVLDNQTLRKGYVLNSEINVDTKTPSETTTPFHRKGLSNPNLSPNHTALTKTTSEDWTNEKRPIIQSLKHKIPCPFCASFDKQILFNSQHDLNLHIRGLHSGYPIKTREAEQK